MHPTMMGQAQDNHNRLPFRKEGKQEAHNSPWSTAILKSSKAHVTNSLLGAQGYCHGYLSILTLPSGLLVLPSGLPLLSNKKWTHR